MENVVSVHDTLRGMVKALLTDGMPLYYMAGMTGCVAVVCCCVPWYCWVVVVRSSVGVCCVMPDLLFARYIMCCVGMGA